MVQLLLEKRAAELAGLPSGSPRPEGCSLSTCFGGWVSLKLNNKHGAICSLSPLGV